MWSTCCAGCPQSWQRTTTACGHSAPTNSKSEPTPAWQVAGLNRLTLHDCRHTFASLAIAAGVNAKALSTYLGHSTVAITLDRYGHLMPGNEAEAAGLLDAYLRDSCATVGA